LEGWKDDAPSWWTTGDEKTITALRAALEQPEQPWKHAGSMPPEQEAMKEAAYNLAPWLSAALDDPEVCQEYKAAINAWFDTAMPAPLEQPEQEPVAWMYQGIKHDGTTHGPHLVWKPEHMDVMSAEKGAKAVPLYAALKERNA
jgi:hypothetical protein